MSEEMMESLHLRLEVIENMLKDSFTLLYEARAKKSYSKNWEEILFPVNEE